MKILFISRRSEKCGVADYGKRLFAILNKELDITFLETDGTGLPIDYSGYDIALYNYHYATMPWINTDDRSIKHVALFHEAFQNHLFDQIINVSELPRPLYNSVKFEELKYLNEGIPYKMPIIGSFGFGFPDKNYVGIADMIATQFNEAAFRLHVPYAEFGDSDGSLAKSEILKVSDRLKGTKIYFEVTSGFMTSNQLIGWLSQNDINVFNCVPSHGRGISSSIDYALSAKRPIGVSNSEMYRHLPREVCLDNTTIPELIDKGIKPLAHIYDGNTHDKLISAIRTRLGF